MLNVQPLQCLLWAKFSIIGKNFAFGLPYLQLVCLARPDSWNITLTGVYLQ